MGMFTSDLLGLQKEKLKLAGIKDKCEKVPDRNSSSGPQGLKQELLADRKNHRHLWGPWDLSQSISNLSVPTSSD